jgi:hypothetical protein
MMSDAASTHVALMYGAHEAVLPTQNPWMIDAVIGAEMGLIVTAFLYLESRMPQWFLKGLLLAGIMLRGIAVANNCLGIYLLMR